MDPALNSAEISHLDDGGVSQPVEKEKRGVSTVTSVTHKRKPISPLIVLVIKQALNPPSDASES